MLCRYKFSNPNYRYEQLECVKEECACWHKESKKCAEALLADLAYKFSYPRVSVIPKTKPLKEVKVTEEWKSGK